MFIAVSCACGKQFFVKDSSTGQTACCPICGRRQIIPAAQAGSACAPHSDAATRPNRRRILAAVGALLTLAIVAVAVYVLGWPQPHQDAASDARKTAEPRGAPETMSPEEKVPVARMTAGSGAQTRPAPQPEESDATPNRVAGNDAIASPSPNGELSGQTPQAPLDPKSRVPCDPRVIDNSFEKERPERPADPLASTTLARPLEHELAATPLLVRQFVIWDADIEGTGGGVFAPPLFGKSGFSMIRCVAFSPDGRYLLAGHSLALFIPFGDILRKRFAETNYLALWDMASGEEVRRFQSENVMDPVNVVTFSPDSRRAVCGTGAERGSDAADGLEASLRLWDVETGKELAVQRYQRWNPAAKAAERAIASGAAFSPDGRTILTATNGERFLLEDVRRLDGRLGTALSDYYGLVLWDSELQREQRRLIGPTAPVHDVAFSADGKHAFAASGSRKIAASNARSDPSAPDNAIRQWDLTTGEEVRRIACGEKAVRLLVVSPDGRRLVSSGDDQAIRLWDIAAGSEIHDFDGHRDRAASVAFSSDGRYVAIAGLHSTRLWETETGREALILRSKLDVFGNEDTPSSNRVAFAAGDRQLYAVSSVRRVARIQIVVEVWDLYAEGDASGSRP